MRFSSTLLNAAIIVVQLNFSGAFRLLWKRQTSDFVLPESQLDELLHDPPSISSVRDADIGPGSIDVVSLGSVTRLDYLTGQIAHGLLITQCVTSGH